MLDEIALISKIVFHVLSHNFYSMEQATI